MDLPGLKEYYDHLWAATDPSRPHGPAKLSGHGRTSVTALLPRIGLARRLIVEVTWYTDCCSCCLHPAVTSTICVAVEGCKLTSQVPTSLHVAHDGQSSDV